MKNWDDLIELNEAADGKAREQLAEEMTAAGVNDAVVIWSDERRAYLDTKSDEGYIKLAKHFNVEFDGVDKAPVNDALLARYEQLYEQAREQEELTFEVSSAQELEAKLAEYGAENEYKDGSGHDAPTFICEVETPDKTKLLIFYAPTPELARQIWDHDLF